MKRSILFAAFICIAVFVGAVSSSSVSVNTELAEDITIKKSVDLREGPGSYYKLLVRIDEGTVVRRLDRKQQWIKIETKDKVGWIPEKSTYIGEKEEEEENKAEKKRRSMDKKMQEAFNEMSGDEKDTSDNPHASPAQVAAAVKGFAKKFTNQETGDSTMELEHRFRTDISSDKYRQFKNKRFRNWTWNLAQKRYRLLYDTLSAPSEHLEKMGWGIANVIAKQGLIRNPELKDYLTQIALTVVESSHRYETPIQVYILDSSTVTGFACPDGTVFVTKRALQLMRSEAEFAFFVAHEWAHIVLNHGIEESRERVAKIKAEDAFAEMEQALEGKDQYDKYDKVEENLDKWAKQVYEYVISDRLNKYEFEADHWGVIYTYRAGYNPYAAVDFLQRVRKAEGDLGRDRKSQSWKGTSIEDRIRKIDEQLENMEVPHGFGKTYSDYFKRQIKDLR